MKVLVCGDRYWTDEKRILKELRTLPQPFSDHTVIDGQAPGADSIGYKVAKKLGMKTKRFPADWIKYGKAAGPIRNQQMLDEGKPDIVFAFHDNLKESKGTKNMISRAEKAGVRVRKITHKK